MWFCFGVRRRRIRIRRLLRRHARAACVKCGRYAVFEYGVSQRIRVVFGRLFFSLIKREERKTLSKMVPRGRKISKKQSDPSHFSFYRFLFVIGKGKPEARSCLEENLFEKTKNFFIVIFRLQRKQPKRAGRL